MRSHRPAARTDAQGRQVAADLVSLQELRTQNATTVRAYEILAVDHRNVKESLREREETLRELIATISAAVYFASAEPNQG